MNPGRRISSCMMVGGTFRKARGELGVTILILLIQILFYLPGRRVQGASYNVGWPTTTWTFPPPSASADGWYTDVWAKSHTFHIGDTLVFNYDSGTHNVYELGNATDYNLCLHHSIRVFASGNDSVPLSGTGWHYYICSYYDHCPGKKLKLKIWVSSKAVAASGPGVGPIVGGIVGTICLVIIFVVGLSFMVWHHKGKARAKRWSGPKISSHMATMFSLDNMDSPRRFTYKELHSATKGFSPALLLGQGGFGSVYKGTLHDSKKTTVVAIKQISDDSKQGEPEFVAEVSIIGKIRHRNLVRLHGWCAERGKLLVVYDYMQNGSLDKLLFPDEDHGQSSSHLGGPLTWNVRYSILCGVAAALAYLHEEWELCILHRDIKPSNVLLDAKFNAYLGDFGMARLVDHNKLAHSTLIAGTIGYLAPELPYTRKATPKTDVFSFGVLALEVACGRHAFDPKLPHEEVYLLDWIWSMHHSNQLFEALDPRLEAVEKFDLEQSKLVLQLGLLCSHPDPTSRPTMRSIRQVLAGECALPIVPPLKPTISYSWRSTMVESAHESISIEHELYEHPSVDTLEQI